MCLAALKSFPYFLSLPLTKSVPTLEFPLTIAQMAFSHRWLGECVGRTA